MTKAIVGVIGGSGVYHLPGLTGLTEKAVQTPWGEPSDALRFGRVGSTDVVFLARHGRGHRFTPSTINYRANIDALKRSGVTDIIALSACGSFHRELYPGVFVMIDQFEDRTYRRENTFFGTGCVAHVSMAHPIAPLVRRRLVAAAAAEDIAHKDEGTYICMEGPQFSSLAESLGYQARGADVIGMTGATEAKLAREAEISYATVAMVTDYDCWHEEHGAVNVDVDRQGRARQRRQGGAAHRPGAEETFPPSTRRARSAPTGSLERRDHDACRCARSGTGRASSTRSPGGCSAAPERRDCMGSPRRAKLATARRPPEARDWACAGRGHDQGPGSNGCSSPAGFSSRRSISRSRSACWRCSSSRASTSSN